MKKIILTLTLIFCFNLATPTLVNAEEIIEDTQISIDIDNESIEDYLDIVYDGDLIDGDDMITRDALEVGIKYAEEQSNKKMTRTGGEVWTITNVKTVRAYDPIKTKWINKVSAGSTVSKSYTASFSIRGKFFGHDVTIGGSISKSQSFSGPNGTEKVGSYFATHRAITSIARGAITEYTVRITDKYSGNFIRNHTYKAITNADVDLYGNLITIEASGRTHVRSATTSKVNIYSSETVWRTILNDTVAPLHIAW